MSDDQTRQDHFRAYEAIWRNMERENNLINYRNQWAIVLSAGIGTTEGVLLSALKTTAALDSIDHLFRGGILLLMFVLSCVAVFFCSKSNEAVRAAQNQLEYLKEQYYLFKTSDGRQVVFEADYKWPRPFGDPHDHAKGNIAAITFPKVMLFIWITFALIEGAGAVASFAYGARPSESQAQRVCSEKADLDGSRDASPPTPRSTKTKR